MTNTGLMTQDEIFCRAATGNPLSMSIDKWERAGKRMYWGILKVPGGAQTHLREDTCPLCSSHKTYGSYGPKLWEHCLGDDYHPCPLVEKSEGNLKGCGANSTWLFAYEAAKRGDRKAFMKARGQLLRKLKAARAWY